MIERCTQGVSGDCASRTSATLPMGRWLIAHCVCTLVMVCVASSKGRVP